MVTSLSGYNINLTVNQSQKVPNYLIGTAEDCAFLSFSYDAQARVLELVTDSNKELFFCLILYRRGSAALDVDVPVPHVTSLDSSNFYYSYNQDNALSSVNTLCTGYIVGQSTGYRVTFDANADLSYLNVRISAYSYS
jgi:hypothetical protein